MTAIESPHDNEPVTQPPVDGAPVHEPVAFGTPTCDTAAQARRPQPVDFLWRLDDTSTGDPSTASLAEGMHTALNGSSARRRDYANRWWNVVNDDSRDQTAGDATSAAQ